MRLEDLPSRRHEAWKWSDLRAVIANRAEMLNGAGPVGPEGPVAALAQAMGDGYGPVAVDVAASGGSLENRFTEGDPGSYGSITVRSGATAHLIERFSVSGSRLRPWLPAYTRIEIEPGAILRRIILQDNSLSDGQTDEAVVLNEAVVRMGHGATYQQFVLAEGARFSRFETSVSIEGEGAVVQLAAVYMASAKRHVDLTSRVSHLKPGAMVRQVVKGAVRSGGRSVFQGKFLVAKQAQKTDAEMAHNVLLLEEGAEVFAKPELEIYADDVACAHGNTAGQLDENAIFYLRQRGLQEAEARAMITRAFLIEAVPGWVGQALHDEIERRIDSWLGTRA